jgi:FkbM family methyltransferase
MRKLRSVLPRITGNRISQVLLERGVNLAQYLQGVGSGAEVISSGETGIFSILMESSDPERTLRIFDVGANIGQYLQLAYACLNGCQFHIHSFEPSSEAYAALCDNARNYSNVTLNNFGLGREMQEAELFYDQAGSGLASLSKRRLVHCGITMGLSERVRIETLDFYCREHQIEYIDLLKLDVEGHELDVLNGATRMFSKAAISMVQFEFGGCNIDTRPFLKDFFYFFSDRGMRMARITPSGYLHEIRSYSEVQEQFRTSNFLCYRHLRGSARS